jgi:phosphoglycerate dehydrogenase-like enzyme
MLRQRLPQHFHQCAFGLEEAISYVSEAEVILTFFLSDDCARRAEKLKWIQCAISGVDGVMVPSLRRDVIVTNARGIHGAPVSEAALSMMFALSREIPRTVRNQDRKHWEAFTATLLSGATVGILGVGVIAEALATRCKALGMTVAGISATPREVPGFDRIYPRADLAKVAGEFDYLVVISPLTEETRSLVNADVLRAMKPTARLVNVGRGAVIDEEALIRALREDWIAGAALDAFLQEPLPADHPFWSMKNVYLTPHIAGRHDGMAAQICDIFQTNLRHYLNNDLESMINVTNRAALQTGAARLATQPLH